MSARREQAPSGASMALCISVAVGVTWFMAQIVDLAFTVLS